MSVHFPPDHADLSRHRRAFADGVFRGLLFHALENLEPNQ